MEVNSLMSPCDPGETGASRSDDRMTDTSKLKRMIGRIDDLEVLSEISKSIYARKELLNERKRKLEADQWWEKARGVKVGDVLKIKNGWMEMPVGGRINFEIKDGECVRVAYIQPKARRIWFRKMDDLSKTTSGI